MSSTVIDVTHPAASEIENVRVLSDTVSRVRTTRRPAMLSREHRRALRHRLRELALIGEDRVETVAAMGLGLVAAYDLGVRDAVRDALAKFTAGTFGMCESCHEVIPAERLDAVPYARRCAACQRRWEAGWDQVQRLVGGVVRTLVGEPQGPSVRKVQQGSDGHRARDHGAQHVPRGGGDRGPRGRVGPPRRRSVRGV